jgi:hypothetical protein
MSSSDEDEDEDDILQFPLGEFLMDFQKEVSEDDEIVGAFFS